MPTRTSLGDDGLLASLRSSGSSIAIDGCRALEGIGRPSAKLCWQGGSTFSVPSNVPNCRPAADPRTVLVLRARWEHGLQAEPARDVIGATRSSLSSSHRGAARARCDRGPRRANAPGTIERPNVDCHLNWAASLPSQRSTVVGDTATLALVGADLLRFLGNSSGIRGTTTLVYTGPSGPHER